MPDNKDSLTDLHSSLTQYTDQVFKSLRRADQRRWACAYLAGVLTTPGKKSVRRLANAVSSTPVPVHSLRQFVHLSPWDWDPVMRELTHWSEGHEPARAWTMARALLPKRGERSVGVQSCFDATSGRTLNCQLGLAAFLCIGGVQVPVDWRLLLPPAWTEDEQLRRRARIPEEVRHLPQWQHALETVDALAARSPADSVPVVADMSEDPNAGLFLSGLIQRRRDFVVAVPHNLRVHPADDHSAHAHSRAGVVALASAGSVPETVTVSTVDGGRRTRILATPVRLPEMRPGSFLEYPCRLFVEAFPGNRPGLVWITNLAHAGLDRIASLAELRAHTVATLDIMERDYGLHDFEGRSFPGWYHHMTLVSAAYAYRKLAGQSSPVPQEQRCAGAEPNARHRHRSPRPAAGHL
jgi:hypothetical protein